MRKDELSLFAVLQVEGVNFSSLLKRLKREKIGVYGVKYTGKKSMLFSTPKRNLKKVFAIGEDLCYNISIRGYRGLPYLFYALSKNIGIIIGIVLFSLTVFLSSFTVFSVEVKGSAEGYKRDILTNLRELGIKNPSFVTGGELKSAEKELLSRCGYLSFVTLKKQGFYLTVRAELRTDGTGILQKDKKQLISSVSGRITRLIVYRGNALKKVGDEVFVGERIITGDYTVGEKEYSTYILYECEAECEFVYEYVSDKEGQESIAELFALQSLGERKIINTEIRKDTVNSGYNYIVKIKYIEKL